MTQVVIEKHDGYVGITASGHSGYASVGADIVCAGISTIMLAWREICEELAEKEMIRIMVDSMSDGFMEVLIFDPHNHTKLCFDMVKYALESISEEYPANLSVEWDERE